MSDTGDLLTLAACAKQLTADGDKISRQGLSKYCDAHQLKQQTPNGVRVSLSAVRTHRVANYQREVMTGGVEIPSAPPALPKIAQAATSAPANDDAGEGADVVDLSPARRLKELQVEEWELKNARARDEVVLADEVTAGVADVVVMLRQQLFQAIPDASQALAAELSLGTADERIIRAAMKAVAREALTAFVAAAAQANADLTHESPNATRDRIGQLAVVSAILRRRPARHLAILRERAG